MPSSEPEFDLLILGGGITGAATAREAALAGLSVALIEKGDFASGTSSKSSKLVHGGLRYLEQFELGLVYESCAERAVLSHLAPHLVRPLPFLFPVGERGAPATLLLSAGLLLYGAIGAGRSLGPTRYLRRGQEVLLTESPELGPDGFRGAFRYFDAQADDCLLTLAFLRSAFERGARLRSYTEAVRLLRGRGGAVEGALCREVETGREEVIRARVTASALGAWSNLLAQLLETELPEPVHLTRGAHFFLPQGRLPVSAATVMLDARNRRCYAIPWRGGTLVGTTDEEHAGPVGEVGPTESDRAVLLPALQRFFPGSRIGAHDLLQGFAGLRPLAFEPAHTAPEDVSREERIFEPAPRCIAAVGGKLTTARRTAGRILQKARRILARDFGRTFAARDSSKIPLSGGEIADFSSVQSHIRLQAHTLLGLSPALADRILEREGSNAERALERMSSERELARPLSEALPYTVSDLVWGIEQAFATTPEDLLARRTRLSWEAPAEAENARGLAQDLLRNSRRSG
jgi:glycerol-3-phosphate dehydrogenase